MKTRKARLFAGLAMGLTASSFLGVLNATPPRLFPDLVERYSVGDTNAQNPLAATEGPKTLTVADLNGDGRADVISGNLDGSVSVLLAHPGGLQDQILCPAAGVLSNSSIRALVVADFNRDGTLDVAAADIAGRGIVILRGNGDGSLVPFQRTTLGPARALDAADFDEDGNMDLLVACSPADCDVCVYPYSQAGTNRFMCVLLGNGDGTFQAPQYLLSPGTPACFYDVIAADMNQDGHVDALALDFSRWETPTNTVPVKQQRILVFQNFGNAMFTNDPPQLVLQAAGQGPRAFRVAYLDEVVAGGTNPPPQATLDIVVANRESRTLDIFLGQGGLSFGSPISLPAGDSPRDVAAGDLDGDGLADLVVVNRNNNTLSILQGMGNGQFSAPILELPTGVSPRQVVLGDMDGDGDLDAAVNNRVSEDISVFWGRAGLAGFLMSDAFYPAGLTPVSVVAEDFNEDGYPDLATANLRSHDVRVRLNLGDGTFGPEAIYPVNYQPAFLAAGDVNQDGFTDLVVSCLGSTPTALPDGRGTLVTLLGRGNGAFQPPTSSPVALPQFRPYWLRLGDLSGDGVLDIAAGGINGALVLFRGAGDGTFGSGLAFGEGADGRPLGLALGDFDRDGRLDMATSRGMVYLNDGQFFTGATNGVWNGFTTRFNSGEQAWAVETEDLDDDGILDLMVALTFRRPDPIGVLYGLGDGSFLAPDVYEGPDVGAVALAGVDMDGDGIKDIVIGNRCAATVIIMQGLDNGRFTLREIILTASVEDVAVADFNHDGRPDLVGVGFGLWPLLNGGTNQLVAPRSVSRGDAPEREGLYLNEIMALNEEFYLVNGTTPDWVEVYNHSAGTQSLAGWSLVQIASDGQFKSWSFPSTQAIGPWGYLTVFCRKKGAAGPGLYAPFDLSAEGEALVLSGPGGAEVDGVRFPAMPADVSYARYLDGARYFGYNPAPTLGSANLRPANLDPSVERKDPYVGAGGTCLGLTGRVFDDVAIAYAAVCYRVAGDDDFWEIPMSDDGRHGDKQPGDGYFGAMLPSLPAGALLEYYLRVVDLEGQVDTSPDDPNDATQLHFLPVPTPAPALRLSELVADNVSGLRDDKAQYEDWLEIVNTGSTPLSLDGLALCKDYFDHLSAWHFPAYTLGPGERLVVFCDEDVRDGMWHTNFKLQRDGDRVFLVRADELWTILDSLSFATLPTDASFGILGSGFDAQLLAWPTPNGANLPLPPQRNPAVEIAYRWLTTSPGGTPSFGLRWLGTTNSTYHVEWSENFTGWTASVLLPTHLGEGLFQWTDSGVTDTKRFYRVVRDP